MGAGTGAAAGGECLPRTGKALPEASPSDVLDEAALRTGLGAAFCSAPSKVELLPDELAEFVEFNEFAELAEFAAAEVAELASGTSE